MLTFTHIITGQGHGCEADVDFLQGFMGKRGRTGCNKKITPGTMRHVCKCLLLFLSNYTDIPIYRFHRDR